jgi:hypothetical protein
MYGKGKGKGYSGEQEDDMYGKGKGKGFYDIEDGRYYGRGDDEDEDESDGEDDMYLYGKGYGKGGYYDMESDEDDMYGKGYGKGGYDDAYAPLTGAYAKGNVKVMAVKVALSVYALYVPSALVSRHHRHFCRCCSSVISPSRLLETNTVFPLSS